MTVATPGLMTLANDKMTITGDRYEFTQNNVDLAPEMHGVYALLDGQSTIYIGKATSIRERLQAHKRGSQGTCTANATHYRRELTTNEDSRERELLAEYQRANGRLPQCNDVMP